MSSIGVLLWLFGLMVFTVAAPNTVEKWALISILFGLMMFAKKDDGK